MSYHTGSVAAVPTANREAYRAHAARAWPHFQRRGALRMVETWGDDVPDGTRTDFRRAVQATPDETVVFSWIEWPDRATCDAAWGDMMADESMGAEMGEMPFDGHRMFWGGFSTVLDEGETRPGAWVQGFVLAVPEANRDAFAALARASWEGFRARGALRQAELWGEDVPHGKTTDFYRATEAEAGEVPVFAWIEWPDRATCDAAARAMQADAGGQPMPEMPFDGKRMFWGGFAPLFDSREGR